MKYLLDTDHLTILELRQGAEYHQLKSRLARADPTEVAVSIVSLHEQAMGCNAYLSRATRPAGVTHGYAMLHRVLELFSNSNVLQFDAKAANEFEYLRAARVRIPTMDLRIAATALIQSLVVVTRNMIDFQRVPGLQCEDWTC